jgi:tRNA-Thr(GGU) m(6)t(6)A37 methyltransferase TsaA
MSPIGVVHTPYRSKYDAPRQPRIDERVDEAVVELHPHMNFEQALQDLDGFSHMWLVTWFDRAGGWKPMVLPPRSERKRGVFSTRSLHRPNPIGISVVGVLEGLMVEDQFLNAMQETVVGKSILEVT